MTDKMVVRSQSLTGKAVVGQQVYVFKARIDDGKELHFCETTFYKEPTQREKDQAIARWKSEIADDNTPF
jgi:hypothetical protein